MLLWRCFFFFDVINSKINRLWVKQITLHKVRKLPIISWRPYEKRLRSPAEENKLGLHAQDCNIKTAGISSLLACSIGFRLASPDILRARYISLCLCCFCFSEEPDIIYNSISMALSIFYVWLPIFISNPDFSLEFQICIPTAYSKISIWIAVGLSNHTMDLSRIIAFHLSHLFSSSLSIPAFN